MVRLKAHASHLLIEPHDSFNSTMVRLKDSIRQSRVSRVDVFQFHNGSIKRENCIAYIKNLKAGFNSTMVRLKAIPVAEPNPKTVCFNSTMVRLKVESHDTTHRFIYSFNSTMVRLKANW